MIYFNTLRKSYQTKNITPNLTTASKNEIMPANLIGIMMMKKVGLFIVVAVLVGVLGVFLSPYYTLYQLKSAYEEGDYGKALSYVDFDKVQANAKQELTARLDKTVSQEVVAELFALLPNDSAGEMVAKAKNDIGQVVDKAVTADNLAKALSGDITDDSKKLVAVWAMASNYVDYQALMKDMMLKGKETAFANQQTHIKEQIIAKTGNSAPTKTTMQYCGLNCFEVTGGVSGVPVGATLTRVGVVGWKVNEIKLP